jgi:hypothetical protein
MSHAGSALSPQVQQSHDVGGRGQRGRRLAVWGVPDGDVGAHAREVPAPDGSGHVVEDALPGPAGEPAGGREVFQAQAAVEEAGGSDRADAGDALDAVGLAMGTALAHMLRGDASARDTPDDRSAGPANEQPGAVSVSVELGAPAAFPGGVGHGGDLCGRWD